MRLQLRAVASWRGGAKERRGTIPPTPPPKLNLSEKFFLVGKCSSKNTKFGLKIPILGEFRGKFKLLRTHNLHCRKIANFCPRPNFSNPRRRRRCPSTCLHDIALTSAALIVNISLTVSTRAVPVIIILMIRSEISIAPLRRDFRVAGGQSNKSVY